MKRILICTLTLVMILMTMLSLFSCNNNEEAIQNQNDTENAQNNQTQTINNEKPFDLAEELTNKGYMIQTLSEFSIGQLLEQFNINSVQNNDVKYYMLSVAENDEKIGGFFFYCETAEKANLLQTDLKAYLDSDPTMGKELGTNTGTVKQTGVMVFIGAEVFWNDVETILK